MKNQQEAGSLTVISKSSEWTIRMLKMAVSVRCDTFTERQIVSAATSAYLNLVEGNQSVYPAEQLKFYSTARGSVAEALAGMELLVKEGRVPEPLAADLQLAGEEISKMMWGLLRRKQRQIHPTRH